MLNHHVANARHAILRRTIAGAALGALSAFAFASAAAQPTTSGLTRLLESELARMPARTGVYVKHLTTGEEAAVRADEAAHSHVNHTLSACDQDAASPFAPGAHTVP